MAPSTRYQMNAENVRNSEQSRLSSKFILGVELLYIAGDTSIAPINN